MAAGRSVFLSHNNTDKPAVEAIAHRLRAAGIEPWLDSWHLVAGEKWQPALEQALTDARASVVFVGPSGVGPWQDEEMRVAIDRRVGDPAFRVVPVLLPGARRGKRSAVPPFLANVTWVEFQRSLDEDQPFQRLIAGIEGRPPGAPTETVPGENPYRGLRVFDVADSGLYFGREALTGWLLSDIKSSIATRADMRLLAVVGASGSGKSSLARAGLFAQLAAGAVEGSERWRQVILKPGGDPLESLAIAGADALALGEDRAAVLKFQDDLAADSRILHTQAGLAMRGTPSSARLLLLVDQFEEVFTLCTSEDRCRAFIDNLLHAAAVADGPAVVVLTLRADFLGKCAVYPRLAAALSDSQELVGPMSRSELREAIERPAGQAGCEFEAGLVEVLVDDVEAQPGGLPLLQHALFELWRQPRAGRRLTHDAYERIGRVVGALARRADEVYRKFSEGEQAVTRRILLRLIQPGEGTADTRRRAPLAEIIPSADAMPTVERIVRILADERLLVTEGEMVDVAHEALINGWPTLRGWLDEDRKGLREHRRLTEAADEWQRLGRDESALYRGVKLGQAMAWRPDNEEALNPLEREFLDASQKLQMSEQVRAQGLIWLQWTVATAVGIAIASGLVFGGSIFASSVEKTDVGFVIFAIFVVVFVVVAGGVVLGFGQWLVLRRQFRQAGWWILATAVGVITALVARNVVFTILGGLNESFRFTDLIRQGMTSVASVVAGGGVLGFAQWLVLRRQFRQAGWWILATAVSMIAVAFVPDVGVHTRQVLPSIVGWFLSGAVVGAITGRLLIWLLMHPLMHPSSKRNAR